MIQISHLYMTTGKTIALIYSIDLCWQSDVSTFQFAVSVCQSFPLMKQASFNFMAAIIVFRDFGAKENKICDCFHFFPIYLPLSDGTRCHDLSFLNVKF